MKAPKVVSSLTRLISFAYRASEREMEVIVLAIQQLESSLGLGKPPAPLQDLALQLLKDSNGISARKLRKLLQEKGALLRPKDHTQRARVFNLLTQLEKRKIIVSSGEGLKRRFRLAR